MATIRLSIGSYSNIRVEVDPLRIRFSGGREYPRLVIPTEVTIEAIKEPRSAVPRFTIINIGSELWLLGYEHKLTDSIIDIYPLSFKNRRDVSYSYHLEFPFDASRLKLIEETRRGDLKLRLSYRLLIGRYEVFLTQGEASPEQKELIADFEEINSTGFDVDIPQSHWVVNVLPTLNLMDYFLIEIPKGNKTLREAWSYLEQAENNFRNWNTKGVFVNCRELGTVLDRELKAKFGAKTFSYKERWGRTYARFSNWASLDLHVEDLKNSTAYPPDTIQTKKIDAEHLLLVAKAMLKYAEELLQE